MKYASFQVLNDKLMLNKVYSDKIIRYAANIPLQARLVEPDASATRRSEFCGSHITIDINVKNGKITEFGQKIDACALGSAASAIVCDYIIGASLDEVANARAQLFEMLTNGGAVPTGRFSELEILQSVAEYPNRHTSTMLILNALVAAIGDLK